MDRDLNTEPPECKSRPTTAWQWYVGTVIYNMSDAWENWTQQVEVCSLITTTPRHVSCLSFVEFVVQPVPEAAVWGLDRLDAETVGSNPA
jgi:hypothetical protein